MSTKLHVLVKVVYSDFDIAVPTPIAVSANVERLRIEAAELNTKLTAEERRVETHYKVQGQVKFLDV
jgi:hypothetical protein